MGKIFGISDLPVSTIMTPFEPVIVFKNPYEKESIAKLYSKRNLKQDTFVSKNAKIHSNPFVRMRNGFGKLMKHFSKKA